MFHNINWYAYIGKEFLKSLFVFTFDDFVVFCVSEVEHRAGLAASILCALVDDISNDNITLAIKRKLNVLLHRAIIVNADLDGADRGVGPAHTFRLDERFFELFVWVLIWILNADALLTLLTLLLRHNIGDLLLPGITHFLILVEVEPTGDREIAALGYFAFFDKINALS